jgi:hypothetical protein
MTLATAVMLCHRFYLHQSLAKNGWQVRLERLFCCGSDGYLLMSMKSDKGAEFPCQAFVDNMLSMSNLTLQIILQII